MNAKDKYSKDWPGSKDPKPCDRVMPIVGTTGPVWAKAHPVHCVCRATPGAYRSRCLICLKKLVPLHVDVASTKRSSGGECCSPAGLCFILLMSQQPKSIQATRLSLGPATPAISGCRVGPVSGLRRDQLDSIHVICQTRCSGGQVDFFENQPLAHTRHNRRIISLFGHFCSVAAFVSISNQELTAC